MVPEADRAVLEFIREHVSSVIELEVLLLLDKQPARGWTAKEVARELRITAEWAQSDLAKLSAKMCAGCLLDGLLGSGPRLLEVLEADAGSVVLFLKAGRAFTAPAGT